MSYQTIYETFRPKNIEIVKMILKENGMDFRVLKENPNAAIPTGTKLQVREDQQEQAVQLLKERGFYRRRPRITDENPSGKFWIYLLVALIIIIVVGIILSGEIVEL